jgi:hypothetical protein
MLKKKLLLVSVVTFFLIAVFHYFALKYSWYWTFRWIDIPAHIVGGFWVSLTALLISLKIKHIDNIFGYKKKALVVMFTSALVIAIFWEMYELIFKITSLHSIGYWKDSLSDILNTIIGGVLAFWYFTKNKKAKCSIMDMSLKNNFVITL